MHIVNTEYTICIITVYTVHVHTHTYTQRQVLVLAVFYTNFFVRANPFVSHANMRRTVSVQLICIFGQQQQKNRMQNVLKLTMMFEYIEKKREKIKNENTKAHRAKVNMRVYAQDLFNIIIG